MDWIWAGSGDFLWRLTSAQRCFEGCIVGAPSAQPSWCHAVTEVQCLASRRGESFQAWKLQAFWGIFTIFFVLGIHSEPFAKLFDGSMSSMRASCVRCSRSAGVVGNSFGNVFGEIPFSCWFTGTGYDLVFVGTALGNTERFSV